MKRFVAITLVVLIFIVVLAIIAGVVATNMRDEDETKELIALNSDNWECVPFRALPGEKLPDRKLPEEFKGQSTDRLTKFRGTFKNATGNYNEYRIIGEVHYAEDDTTISDSKIYYSVRPGETIEWEVDTSAPYKSNLDCRVFVEGPKEDDHDLTALNNDWECFPVKTPIGDGTFDRLVNARGTLTNRTDEAHDYHVTVDVYYAKDGTTVGGVKSYEDVEPGQTVRFKVETGADYGRRMNCEVYLDTNPPTKYPLGER